jgi:hypothetical protein
MALERPAEHFHSGVICIDQGLEGVPELFNRRQAVITALELLAVRDVDIGRVSP